MSSKNIGNWEGIDLKKFEQWGKEYQEKYQLRMIKESQEELQVE